MQDNQEKKPLKTAFRRTLEHCGRWIISGSNTTTHDNPKLNTDSIKKIVIYCIHGTADRIGSFNYFVSHIINQLPDFIANIKIVAFENRAQGECTIAFAKQLKDQIVLNGDKDVILVGHSRGGLVLSYFATYLAEANGINVHLAFPICAPFQGSYLALPPFTFFSKSVAQMQLGSTFLTELSDKVVNSPLNLLYIGASSDKMVYGDAYLPYNFVPALNNHILLQGETHLSAMSSPAMIEFFILHINALENAAEIAPANLENTNL